MTAVSCTRFETVPDSPWKTWMIDPAELVHLTGGECGEERLEPVEHSGEVERRCGLRQRDHRCPVGEAFHLGLPGSTP